MSNRYPRAPFITLLMHVVAAQFMISFLGCQPALPSEGSADGSGAKQEKTAHAPQSTTDDSGEPGISELRERVNQSLDRFDFTEAVKLQALVVEKLTSRFGQTHWETVEGRVNLAQLRRAGRFTDREHDNAASMKVLEQLATRALQSGSADVAIFHLNEALPLAARVWGKDSTAYPHLLDQLAEAYFKKGDYPRAISFEEEASRLQEKLRGVCHPKTIRSMARLSSLYCRAERNAEAEQVAKKLMKASTEVYGPHDIRTLEAKVYLAVARGGQGQETEAIEMLGKVATLLAKQSLTGTTTFADSVLRRADFLYVIGDYRTCIALLESEDLRHALASFDQADAKIVECNSTLLAAKWRLGRDLRSMEKELADRHTRIEQTVGLASEEGMMCLWIQGQTFAALEEWTKAGSALQELSTIASQSAGTLSVDYAISLGMQGIVASKSGRKDEALALSRRSVEILSQLEPTPTRSLAHQQVHLAQILADNEKLDEAESLLAKAAPVFVKELPKGHVDHSIPMVWSEARSL